VFVRGLACTREFWAPQVEHFAARHRVLAVDLRGRGASHAPVQRYRMRAFADDLGWICDQLELVRPVVVGHSLGGLIGLELAAASADRIRAAVLIDSVLLPTTRDRQEVVDGLVAGLRCGDPEGSLREYFDRFFAPGDDPRQVAWILERAIRTPTHVTSSVWEESMRDWDDADALRRCRVPLLYLDAGTDNADLARARELFPELVVGRTIGSGHFSPLLVPEQVNPMLARFLSMLAGE